MEREIILRDAAREGLEAILDVQRLSPGAAAWTLTDYEGLLHAEGTLFLLAEDRLRKQVVGFLLACTAADEMEILNLAVAPAYRRQGIARRLLGQALARVHSQGIGQCWLEVRASNRSAREFYRALGFVESRRRRRYYRDPVEDAVVCVRRLPLAGSALEEARGLC